MIHLTSLKKNNFFRKKIIHLRKQLTYQQQHYISKKINKIIINYEYIKKAKNIAIYLSSNGEVNTYLLISKLLKKKNIYLPVLHPFIDKKLLFIKYKKFEELKINKFNILEPQLNLLNLISLNSLDVIIIPTVAFDVLGNRLGMGSGFYDFTLKNWEKYNFLLIGLAYDFQKLKKIKKNFWDVPLSTIITPTKIYECKKLPSNYNY